MWYNITKDNIYAFIREMGFVKKAQLIEFFSDVASVETVETWLKGFIAMHSFVIDANKETLAFHSAKTPNSAQLNARLAALWIPAYFHSDEIRDIYPLRYPSQLGFITEDEECYDVTFVRDLTIAQRCSQIWAEAVPEGEEDHVIHIALIPPSARDEIADKLWKYGFTNYCILNPENMQPRYFMCDPNGSDDASDDENAEEFDEDPGEDDDDFESEMELGWGDDD